MMKAVRVIPLVLKQLRRSPMRSFLTITGIAVAMFLFGVVESMRNGVKAATVATAEDTTLVVYRENRYCPFSSNLPQFYSDRIERIEGVGEVIPMQRMVKNCARAAARRAPCSSRTASARAC